MRRHQRTHHHRSTRRIIHRSSSSNSQSSQCQSSRTIQRLLFGSSAEGSDEAAEPFLKEDDDAGWQVGDVQADLAHLQNAIIRDNADGELHQQERIDALNHMASSRYCLMSSVRTFILRPILAALVLRAMMQLSRFTAQLSLLPVTVLDVHFWTVVVAAPSLLLLLKLVSTMRSKNDKKTKNDEMTEDTFLGAAKSNWLMPSSFDGDHVRFLLEYLTSAGLGMAIGRSMLHFFPCKISPDGLVMSVCQLITRIGAVASLYQFPEQLYRLQRNEQPRPFGFFTTATRGLVRCMLAAFPFALAADLSKVLKHLTSRAIVSLYLSVAILCFGTRLRMQLLEEPDNTSSSQILKPRSTSTKFWYICIVIAIWKRSLRHLLHQFRQSGSSFVGAGSFWMAVVQVMTVAFIPLLSPIIHLKTVGRLFRVSYTHNLPLTMKAKAFKKALQKEGTKQNSDRFKWRYMLQWPDHNVSLPKLLLGWYDNLGYWLFIKGSSEQRIEKRRSRELRTNAISEQVWKMEEMSRGKPIPDSDELRTAAMQALAQKHQKDYETNVVDDPLGMAVQQTFGIGLGYEFRHMKELKPGETASTSRLQARAAKSAIKRVQSLYDEQSIAEGQALLAKDDPSQRQDQLNQLEKTIDGEVVDLGQRLTELVPTNDCDNDFDDDMKSTLLKPPREKYVTKSPHEVIRYIEDPTVGSFWESNMRGAEEASADDDYETNVAKSSDEEETGESSVVV